MRAELTIYDENAQGRRGRKVSYLDVDITTEGLIDDKVIMLLVDTVLSPLNLCVTDINIETRRVEPKTAITAQDE